MSRGYIAFALGALVPVVTLLAVRFPAGGKRRSHFRLRVVILCLSMPAVVSILIGLALLLQLPDSAVVPLVLFLVFLNIVAPVVVEPILYSAADSSSGGGGEGWGHGPDEPPSGPDRPSGELPLADTEAGRWRLRDHNLPEIDGVRSRRPAREPERVHAH